MINKENIDNEKEFNLTRFVVLVMAVTCGVTVANLYFIQPLLTQVTKAFDISESSAGFVVTLTQIGYALGLFFFVPLGDMKERRSLITKMLIFVAIALLAVAFSPNYFALLVASFFIGFTTIIPQLIVPFAAQLAKPSERGKIIGTVMSGLLIGILLSRVFSGIVGQAFGWRTVYVIAGLLMLLLAVFIKYLMPVSKPTSRLSYKELIFSISGIIKKERVLRESAINGALMFGSFSIFWTSLVFLLQSNVYNMGTREAGLFGLIGVVGASAAPIIGRVADKKSPKFAVGIGVVLSTLAYVIFFFFGYKLFGLIAGVILLDLGNQTGQVSNQARIQALNDEARSRINTVFMVSYFIGGAFGSYLASISFEHSGWNGVCVVGFAFQFVAVIFHFLVYRKKK
ncbi:MULTISPECIES: MFS transporter [Clostridium]|uniref:MFS transporter n=1 Tax=Clostridium TaxID=1485 RepID=UPI00069CCEFF|nr:MULTISPECIES: MFS transporter [Clostridium]KOF58262.1 MFS transporter permease [Clostridium sp. DMHC 10]MCD2348039.1 MFS transporter [Clostridium guangxiense]